MVPSEKMKKPVREKHRDFLKERLSCRKGLLPRGFDTDDDIAKDRIGQSTELAFVHRECEDVGRPVFSAIDLVQFMNSIIVG